MIRESVIVFLSACVLNALAASCPAQPSDPAATRLSVQIGWGEKVRAGRWTPVFVTTSSPKPRATVVEAYAMEGGAEAMRVRQFLTIGPVPTTVTLFIPVPFNGSQGPTVLIREEVTGKTLAHYPPDPDADDFLRRGVNGASPLIGVSGLPTLLQGLTDALPAAGIETGYLSSDLLPATPIGYDGLNLLVLNRPDLLHLPGGTQQAIVDWVAAGGNLILWPGEDNAPRSGPLIDALPCRIGGGRNATIGDADLRRLGLPARFASVRGRRLEPVPAGPSGQPAEPIRLFGSSDDPDDFAYRRRTGLGQILVAPVDLSDLRFDDADHAGRFWEPLLAGMSTLPHNSVEPVSQAGTARRPPPPGSDADQDTRRQDAACRTLERYLGGPDEAAGAAMPAGDPHSGFSDFAGILLAFMAVAGPVDWFVLRRLGRRPWTWVTTTALLVLFVGGGVYLERLFTSRPLSYQSIRVTDQADNGAVAEAVLARISPSGNGSYLLDAVPEAMAAPDGSGPATSPAARAGGSAEGSAPPPPPGWWAVPGTEDDGSRHGLIHDVVFHQTDHGNAPDPLRLGAGDVRILRQDAARGGPPLLDVKVSVTGAAGVAAAPHVKGVVTNMTAKPYLYVRIRTKAGTTPPIDRIEPGGSAVVDADVEAGSGALFSDRIANAASRFGHDWQFVSSADLWRVAGDLAGVRSRRIDDLLDSGRFVCAYAETAGATPPAVLRKAGEAGATAAGPKHYELVRAVVPVTTDGARP